MEHVIVVNSARKPEYMVRVSKKILDPAKRGPHKVNPPSLCPLSRGLYRYRIDEPFVAVDKCRDRRLFHSTIFADFCIKEDCASHELLEFEVLNRRESRQNPTIENILKVRRYSQLQEPAQKIESQTFLPNRLLADLSTSRHRLYGREERPPCTGVQ